MCGVPNAARTASAVLIDVQLSRAPEPLADARHAPPGQSPRSGTRPRNRCPAPQLRSSAGTRSPRSEGGQCGQCVRTSARARAFGAADAQVLCTRSNRDAAQARHQQASLGKRYEIDHVLPNHRHAQTNRQHIRRRRLDMCRRQPGADSESMARADHTFGGKVKSWMDKNKQRCKPPASSNNFATIPTHPQKMRSQPKQSG